MHICIRCLQGFCDNADSTAIKFIIYSTHCVYLADIDDCVGVTCSGHGTCVDGVNSHSCNCNAGFTGYMCETSMLFIPFFLKNSNKFICTSVRTWPVSLIRIDYFTNSSRVLYYVIYMEYTNN